MPYKEKESFEQAASALGKAAVSLLSAVSDYEKAAAYEIRLRVGSPVVLSLPSGLKTTGSAEVTREIMDDAVLNLCGHSVYTHQHELAAGYISVTGGHRAGISGKAVMQNGIVVSLSEVNSICLRIARDFRGCSERLFSEMFDKGICSAIIAGMPGSGKTTVLRDMARLLAEGRSGIRLAVAIVDERQEIALSGKENSVWRCCEVLSGYSKYDGITQAIRGLAPDVIVCDEIGTERDLQAIIAGVNAGVHIICSIHAGNRDELIRRPVVSGLIATGAFDRVAILGGREKPGQVSEIMNGEEVYELARRCTYYNLLSNDRTGNVHKAETALRSPFTDRLVC